MKISVSSDHTTCGVRILRGGAGSGTPILAVKCSQIALPGCYPGGGASEE